MPLEVNILLTNGLLSTCVGMLEVRPLQRTSTLAEATILRAHNGDQKRSTDTDKPRNDSEYVNKRCKRLKEK